MNHGISNVTNVTEFENATDNILVLGMQPWKKSFTHVITCVREIKMITEFLLLLLFCWWNTGTEKLDKVSYYKVTIDQF